MFHYKAKIRQAGKYTHLADTSVIMPISVGQAYHEGKMFVAIMELIKKNFNSCEILVADTLQRVDLKNCDQSGLLVSDSYNQGTMWIKRNSSAWLNANIPIKLTRWHKCLQHKSFTSERTFLLGLFKNNDIYQAHLNHDISVYLERFAKKTAANDYEKNILRHRSFNYIIEETAVVCSYFIEKEFDYILYPSRIPQSIEWVMHNIVQIGKQNKLASLSVYFKKVLLS